MKKLIALLVASSLAGCVTSQTASTFVNAPIPEAKADKAILYIFRDYAEPTAFAAYFEIDKREAVSLNQQGFTWVYVQPGAHNFKFAWPFMAGMPSVEFKGELEAGKTYAFQMYGSAGMTISRSAVAPIEMEEAKARMTACCRYVASTYKDQP